MNAEAEASESWFLHWTLLFNLYYLQLQRQCQRRVSTFYILFFGMSNDNNFHVENWLQVSHLGSNILCNLQCNISAVFPERRRLWRYLNFYSNNLAASLGCRVNTKHGGNCVSSCKGLPLRVLRKIICNYNWYYFVLEYNNLPWEKKCRDRKIQWHNHSMGQMREQWELPEENWPMCFLSVVFFFPEFL